MDFFPKSKSNLHVNFAPDKINGRGIAVIFIALLMAFFLGISARTAEAHNVSGWAWSETAGWVSLSCDNLGTCATIDYGVDVDPSSGNFSGYAWSENLGWIMFNPPKDPDTNQYPAAPQESTKLDGNQVKGWARACVGTVNNDCDSSASSAWDGWIKMSGAIEGGGTYGVVSEGCYFSGYAWAGIGGGISFRGTTQTGAEYGVSHTLCPNPPPIANSLSLSLNYCASSPYISFSWLYVDPDGENEGKFEFQVDDNGDFSSPAINRVVDGLDVASPAVNTQVALLTSSPQADKLAYNSGSYYWRVRVWDVSGNSSLWVGGNGTFTMPVHAYPAVGFVWAPLNPGVGEETQFLDESEVFGSPLALRLWTFPPASFVTDKTTADSDPKVKFTACGDQPVSLRIDDSTGYSCALSQTVSVKTAHCWTP